MVLDREESIRCLNKIAFPDPLYLIGKSGLSFHRELPKYGPVLDLPDIIFWHGYVFDDGVAENKIELFILKWQAVVLLEQDRFKSIVGASSGEAVFVNIRYGDIKICRIRVDSEL